MSDHVFGPRPPGDGQEWECQCARCGSSVDWLSCQDCCWGYCGEWGEDDDDVRCDTCNGDGGGHVCLSSPAYCQANPLPGREDVQRGTIEWFPDTPNFVERHL